MQRLLILVVIVLAGCAKQDTPVVSCAALTQGCVLDQGKIFVETTRTPAPLKPFDIIVVAPSARTVNIELNMQGMEMGLNRYRLIRQANGEWRANITLPVCVMGRQDWRMVIEVDGAKHALAFQTS